MKSIFGRGWRFVLALCFIGALSCFYTTPVWASYPSPKIIFAQIWSLRVADGTVYYFFLAQLKGPSPLDVDYFRATGPSGTFNLIPTISSREVGLYYQSEAQTTPLTDGQYTFEVGDLQGRTHSVVRDFTYNASIPTVDSASMIPAGGSYVGTTTPTLQVSPVAGAGFYYGFQVRDSQDNAMWYSSDRSTSTQVTVPPGLLQPNAPYYWVVRVSDRIDDPQSRTQSERRYFFTGTKGVPDVSDRMILTVELEGAAGVNWFAVRNLGIAPWSIASMTVTDPNSQVYNWNAVSHRFGAPVQYAVSGSTPYPPPDGTYQFDVTDDAANHVFAQTAFSYDPITTFPTASMWPPDNAYFNTPNVTFRWGEVTQPGDFLYYVRINDYNNRIIWVDQPSADKTSLKLPAWVIANPNTGSWTLKWRVLVLDQATNNLYFSPQRTFTVNGEAGFLPGVSSILVE